MSTNLLQPVQLSWGFKAPPARVFDAWANPTLMRRWMFVSDRGTIDRVRAGKRPGDRFLVREMADGEEIEHFGTYLEINPPTRLVFTLEVPKRFRGTTTVTVELTPDGTGSRMAFTHSGADAEVTEPAWRRMFAALEWVLDEPEPAAAMTRQ